MAKLKELKDEKPRKTKAEPEPVPLSFDEKNVRKIVIETDGRLVRIKEIEVSDLEFDRVLEILGGSRRLF